VSTSAPTADTRPRAASVKVEDGRIRVMLTDGRDIGVPIDRYAWLAAATPEEQADVGIIEYGLGIWWDSIDEGLSVPGLLGLPHV
jgi:hypothetical protein